MKLNQANRAVLFIIISAFLVSILFNIRTLITMFEFLSDASDDGLGKSRIQSRFKFTYFNLIIEFTVFSLVAFFNYSWLDKLIDLNRFKRAKITVIILSNLVVFFILIPAGKLFHNAYFSSLEDYWDKEINFDIRNYLIINISVFLMAIVVARLLLMMKKMKVAEKENIRLVEEKSKAELSALKEQISPHFFFNTLSSLSSIVRNDNREKGLEFIGEMSKTYRYTLEIKKDLVPLKEELDFLKSYLYLLKQRYGEKLIFKNELSDANLKSMIPPMSLQLLVENAIQHNLITKSAPLTIRVFVENEMICVENDLQEKESAESFGIGLQNLGERYRLLTRKEIIITKDRHHFCVNLPLLKYESADY